MSRNPPNPFQKLVRGMIQDLINQRHSQNADKPVKQKSKKSAATKSQSKPKPDGKKRSQIPNSHCEPS